LKYFLCLLFFALLLPNSSRAVNLIWADYPDGRLYKIDLSSQSQFMETSPNLWVNLGKVTTININENDFPPDVRVHSFEVNSDKEARIFLIDCTNQVYHFNFKSRVLERIDKTYYRGYNCFSTKFMRKDTLFNFGGYGFWQTINIQSFFRKSSNEWESYSPLNDAPKAINDGFNGYAAQNDIFFSAFNTFHRDSENQGKPQYDYGVYSFSFKSKTWQKEGEINPTNFEELGFDKTKPYTLWTGKYFLTKYYDVPQAKFHLADPINNKLYLWTDNNKLIDSKMGDPDHEIFRFYCWHDTLYCYNHFDTKNSEVRKIRLPLNQIKKEAVLIGNFYETGMNWKMIAMLSMGGILLIIGGIYVLKNRKKEANSTENVTVSPFNSQERIVIKALIEQYENGGLENQEIHELLGITHKTSENQRKIKNEFIKSLNAKLMVVYGINESIIRTPTDLDKRFFKHELNKESFDVLKGDFL
jgi:uncharacterized membrane protein